MIRTWYLWFIFLGSSLLIQAQDTIPVLDIGTPAMANPNKRAVLKGKISNPETGENLIGATIFVSDLDLGTATNDSGHYVLILPVGRHELIFRSIGQLEKKRIINLYTDGVMNVGLGESYFSLEEIVVKAKRSDQNISDVKTGTVELSVKDINNLPTLLGELDVMKSLLLLPGVSTVGEGAGGINVRGGRTDQNLVLFDDAHLLNTSHALGIFSAFNPDVVETITLFKGSVPAQFGGRSASVLNVSPKSGDFDQLHVKAGLGAIIGRILVEGPISKGKTSFLAAGRTSYAGWVLESIEKPEIRNSKARFSDINGVISHRFNQNHQISLSYYHSFDLFQYSEDFGYRWKTENVNLKSKNILSVNFSSNTHFSAGKYRSTLFEPKGLGAFDFQNGQENIKLKQNFFWNPANKHKVQFGGEWVRYNSLPDEIDPKGENSGILKKEVSRERGDELAFFLNEEVDITPRIAISAGLRYSAFRSLGTDTVFVYEPGLPVQEQTIIDTLFFGKGKVVQSYAGFEPRFSIRYKIGKNSSIKASYNRMRQYLHLISNTTASTPVDVWQLSNRYIQPQIADNFSAGLFRNFYDNNLETSIEGFYRITENQYDYKDFANLLLNRHLETEVLPGKGKAYGVEVLLKQNAGKLTGWLSYTWTRSFIQVKGTTRETTVNGGNWYPTSYDKPHDVTLAAKYTVNKNMFLGFNFTYNTGRPITGILSSYIVNNTVIPHFSDRNAYRIPDYYRLDFSVTIESKKLVTTRYRGSFVFTVYNLLSRRNPFSVYYQQLNNFFIPSATKLSVLGTMIPAVSYNISF